MDSIYRESITYCDPAQVVRVLTVWLRFTRHTYLMCMPLVTQHYSSHDITEVVTEESPK